jgi:hypothetical protein
MSDLTPVLATCLISVPYGLIDAVVAVLEGQK